MDASRSQLWPLPVADVQIDDAFWTPRLETVRTSTLWAQLDKLRTVGHFDALKLTWRPGDQPEPHIFWDSDVAKWIEAASYTLATHPDLGSPPAPVRGRPGCPRTGPARLLPGGD